MLIPSERHTKADLELWEEIEAADLLHYDRLVDSGKVERSMEAVVSFGSPFYAAFSGGKDSLAVLELLRQAGALQRTPVVFFLANPKANPDAVAAVDAAQDHFRICIQTVPYDSPVPQGGNRAAAEVAATTNFMRACEDVSRRLGRRVLGLRADESAARKIRFRRWGLTTENCCAPLGWWTAEDVYAFAAGRELPLCSVYAMLGAGRWARRHLRVDALFGEIGSGLGRSEWEQEYYGDVLRRLSAGR